MNGATTGMEASIVSHGRTLGRQIAAAMLLLGLTAAPASATRLRSLNIETMTQRATTIFSGRCIDAERKQWPAAGREIVEATFVVDRMLKGQAAETLTVRFVHDGTVGVPRLARGEEVVLFLYGTSALGLTSPVGLGQGKFSVTENKLGRAVAVNEFGNDRLFDGLSATARTRLESVVLSTGARPVERHALIEIVQRLVP